LLGAAGRAAELAMKDPRANLELARKVVSDEARYIGALAGRIDERFARAAEAIYRCRGTVILTGIGKPGFVAQKISATLASTGTPSIFLHPVEALHGDLGRVRRGDVVVALSHSGTTDELLALVDHLQARGAKLVAVTAKEGSPLASYADIALCYGDVEEACPHGMAPTVSTSCMLALGDALALTVMDQRLFTPEEFVAFHPGGPLARALLKVEEAMTFRKGPRLPVFDEGLTVRQVLAEAEKIQRRAGAVLLTGAGGRLTGILTDADLRRRMLEGDPAALMGTAVGEVMVRDPKRIRRGELASKALALMNQYRIDELPVVDDAGRPVGLLDVQDLVGLKAFSDGQD